MSPAHRSIADLRRIGSLEPVPLDEAAISAMLQQATKHLVTAAAGIDHGDHET